MNSRQIKTLSLLFFFLSLFMTVLPFTACKGDNEATEMQQEFYGTGFVPVSVYDFELYGSAATGSSVYVCHYSNGLWCSRSADKGKSWEIFDFNEAESSLSHSDMGISVNGGKMVVAYRAGRDLLCSRSSDSGKNWEDSVVKKDLEPSDVTVEQRGDDFYVVYSNCTEHGLHVSEFNNQR